MSGVSWAFPLLWPGMSAAGQPRKEVVGAGFEPAKAEPTGLQPVPFDRSGTPPGGRTEILAAVIPLRVRWLAHFWTGLRTGTLWPDAVHRPHRRRPRGL